MSARRRPAALVIALLAACSGSSSGAPDASLADAAPGITPPAPPAPPVFTPCPPGWREVMDGDLVTCDPFPEGGALTCASDEAHFPGEPGCVRLGPVCPADGWPVDLPAGVPVLWVRAGSAPGGTGTQASPFATIGSAASAASPGTVIAVASGLYEEGFTLGKAGLVVQGACVAGTRVAAPVPAETAGTIHVTASVELRNLTVSGERNGIIVFPAGSAVVENVVVEGTVVTGIHVEGGTLEARNIVVRDVRPRPSNGTLGRGLNAIVPARVEVTRAVLERNHETGVLADAETSVTLSDVVVRDTQAQASDLLWGHGLGVQFGAQVVIERSVFERNHEVGVAAYGPGTTVSITDTIVRDTLSRASDRWFGSGLTALGGARVEVSRTAVDRNHWVAVLAGDDDTTVVLSDVAVRDTWGEEAALQFGIGVGTQPGARVEVERGVFLRNRYASLYADAATLVLTDVTVRDTASELAGGRRGRGLSAQSRARVEVTRALFERNRDSTVTAHHAGTSIVLTDLVVRDSLDQECRVLDTCLWSSTNHLGSYDGASVEVRRFVLERSAFLGVQIAPIPPELGGVSGIGGTIDLHEGVVADNPIGINIQTEGFDVRRIRDRVTWGPNIVNIVTDALPVPAPGAASGP